MCRVPNIKFNVAKVLQSLIPIVDQSVSGAVAFYFSVAVLPKFITFLVLRITPCRW